MKAELTIDGPKITASNVDKLKRDLPGVAAGVGWNPPLHFQKPSRNEAHNLILVYDASAQLSERKLYTDLWQLADVLNYLEDVYGEEFWQFVPETEFARKTYTNAMRIGKAFSDWSRRHDPEEVSFWLHGDVAAEWIEEWEADELLESYSTGEMNRPEFRAEISKLRRERKEKEVQQEVMDLGVDEWPTCPMCAGAGKVSPDKERAYFDKEHRRG